MGIETYDEQHKRLIATTNELHEAMQAGEGRERTGAILSDIEQYTETHFSDEEEFMAECSYQSHCQSCVRSHHQAHEEFTEQVADFRERFDDGEVMLTMDVMHFLREWLTSRIGSGEMDQDYGDYYACERSE